MKKSTMFIIIAIIGLLIYWNYGTKIMPTMSMVNTEKTFVWAPCSSDSDCTNNYVLYFTKCTCEYRMVPIGKKPLVDCGGNICTANNEPGLKCISGFCGVNE